MMSLTKSPKRRQVGFPQDTAPKLMRGIWPCFGTPFRGVLQLSESLVLDLVPREGLRAREPQSRTFSV
jgi:hypothetical protein